MKTRGGFKEVILLAFPAVISMISHSVMSMTDTIMVGKLGASEIAAVGLANVAIFTVYGLFMGIIEILETFVSQSFGSGERKKCAHMAWQGLYLSLIFGSFVLIFNPMSDWLFSIIASTDAVQTIGAAYFRVRLYGASFFLSCFAFSSFFIGTQDTKTPMKISIVANIINITLDYALIFGAFGLPKLGATGAGLATVLANGTSVLLYAFMFLKKQTHESYGTRIMPAFDWLEVKRIIKIGLPLGIEMFLRIASFLIFSALIGAVGDRQLAASQICIQIIRFSFMPGYGLAVATTALVGKYIGAKNINAATKSVKSSLAIGAIYASALAVILLTLAQPIVGLFNTDPTVVAICRRIMFLAAFLQFFDIIAIVASGALRGAGDTKWIMKATLYGSWLVGLPIAIFFCAFIKLGAFGAWIGLTSETLFLATIFYLRFYKGKWKEIRL